VRRPQVDGSRAGIGVPTAAPSARHRWGLAALAAVNAGAAWIGMFGLLAGWLSLGSVVTGRLPFSSLEVAGLALGALVAVPSTVLAIAAFNDDPRTGPMAVRVGALLILWIVGQVFVIRTFSFFQPICLVLGAWFVIAGMRTGPNRR
jgi:hypothetical protein